MEILQTIELLFSSSHSALWILLQRYLLGERFALALILYRSRIIWVTTTQPLSHWLLTLLRLACTIVTSMGLASRRLGCRTALGSTQRLPSSSLVEPQLLGLTVSCKQPYYYHLTSRLFQSFSWLPSLGFLLSLRLRRSPMKST